MFGTVKSLTGVGELTVEASFVHVWRIGAEISLTGYEDLVV